MGEFYTNFYKNKWIFFYQLVLQILKTHEIQIMDSDELYSILH